MTRFGAGGDASVFERIAADAKTVGSNVTAAEIAWRSRRTWGPTSSAPLPT